MRGTTHIYGRKPTRRIWLTCSESKAKSPKPSRSNCRRICPLTRKRGLRNHPRRTRSPTIFICGPDNSTIWRMIPTQRTTYFRASACWRKRFGAIRNSCVRTVSCAKLISICIGVELITLNGGVNWPESLCKKPKKSSRTREVHAQKGLYAYHGFRDYAGALKELERAKELLPNEAR